MSKKKKTAQAKNPPTKISTLDPEIAKRLDQIAPSVHQSAHEPGRGVRPSRNDIRPKAKFHPTAQTTKVAKDGIGAKKG